MSRTMDDGKPEPEHPAFQSFLKRCGANLGLATHAEWYAFRDGWEQGMATCTGRSQR